MAMVFRLFKRKHLREFMFKVDNIEWVIRFNVVYQQLKAMYDSGCQICCNWSRHKLGFNMSTSSIGNSCEITLSSSFSPYLTTFPFPSHFSIIIAIFTYFSSKSHLSILFQYSLHNITELIHYYFLHSGIEMWSD